jgi:hypothetical protein
MALPVLPRCESNSSHLSLVQKGKEVVMSDQRYGDYEQVNGACVNAANDRANAAEAQRDTAWAELREIREAIPANTEESTADEVRRVVAQCDKLLASLTDLLARVDERCGGKAEGNTPLVMACDEARALIEAAK